MFIHSVVVRSFLNLRYAEFCIRYSSVHAVCILKFLCFVDTRSQVWSPALHLCMPLFRLGLGKSCWELTCDGLVSRPGRVNRDFKIRRRQRRRDRQRTITLITEYNSCTLECSERTTCSPSSSVIRLGKLTFGVLWTTWTSNNKIFDNLCLPSWLNLLSFTVQKSHAKP